LLRRKLEGKSLVEKVLAKRWAEKAVQKRSPEKGPLNVCKAALD